MYTFLLRWLPARLANIAIACWYGGLLFLLWLKWGGDVIPGFRYGQILPATPSGLEAGKPVMLAACPNSPTFYQQPSKRN